MGDYAKNLFIRKGWEKVQTGILNEATPPGSVINLQDMSQYDAGDMDLGIVINDVRFSTALGSNITQYATVYFITLADAFAVAAEIYMYEVNAGAISAGVKVAVTTGGKITTWAYDEDGGTVYVETHETVLGISMAGHAQNGGGWVKFQK